MPNPTPQTPLDRRTEAVRAFNRFYTRRIGVVREGYLQSRFSLTEARVLYELAQTDGLTATQIGTALDLDAGYLSRMLRRFEQDGLLTRGTSGTDRRQSILTLTEVGRAAFTPLDQRSRQEIGAMLAALPLPAQEAVVGGMQTIARMLSDCPSPDWTTRNPAPGDIGWVIERHGALYAQEYGFNHKFEALVAQIAGAFLNEHDLARERGWIAERDGVRLGSVFLMHKTDEIAKLRLLLVEPSARGLGIGKRLVDDCIAFARHAGYRRLTLWTNDILVAARGIYRTAGFQLVSSEPHSDFGPPMVGEEWDLEL
jgi:DNA-binding MarR family transcriptional regulator/GNAT superfamily N-acetyltransferase